jgi:two-component system sensor kinase
MTQNKILVVEDEKNIQETIKELLTLKNYEVQTANNGQEALDLLGNWMPDLIISDIMMPMMDGHELHEIVRESKALCAIPFLFLTAKKGQDIARVCLLDGVDDFISKPFRVKDLLQRIEIKIKRFNKIKNNQNNIYIGEKKDFLHEVNTPLNGILGFINLLLDNENELDKEDIKIINNSIKSSAERLKRTTSNLIMYENIKNNQLTINTEEKSEIQDVFLKAKELILKDYPLDDAKITFALDKTVIKMSEENLIFILFELMDNALKFSSDTKKISITGTKFNSNHYEINIKDFGIGFKESELKKINAAEQFNREKREQQGLGLGLYLSKFITKKSHGVFSILSKEGFGTTISLLIPSIN